MGKGGIQKEKGRKEGVKRMEKDEGGKWKRKEREGSEGDGRSRRRKKKEGE